MTTAGTTFDFNEEIFRQRQRTADILRPWGLRAVFAWPGSNRPIEKVSDAAILKTDPNAWANQVLDYNLLGIMPADMVDFDLDVRLKADPSTRALDWSESERTDALSLFRVFRESFKVALQSFDYRSLFGRASLEGNGHLLLKIETAEDVTRDERRARLRQLQFKADLGHFTIKLEVRQPAHKKESSKAHCRLPGSTYDNGELCAFHSLPKGSVHPTANVLDTYPLALVAKAVYRAALLMALTPHVAEGQRHEVAMLASGVLRREVEHTEQEGGGGFNRDDAEEIFQTLFRGDPELKDRMQIFARDFADYEPSRLPGYKALGDRIGEETARALRVMLHGQDVGQLDSMRENIIFVRSQGYRCVDLSQRTATGPLTLYEHMGVRNNYAHQFVQLGRKRVPAFDILRTWKNRREVDDTVQIPGYPRGLYLYQTTAGELFPERHDENDQLLLNISSGWATPYDPSAPTEAAARGLEEMLSWLSHLPEDRAKIMQMWAFKAQHPLIKPQFALGISGGQGIGKGFVLHDLPRLIFGLTVKRTSADMMFGDRFPLQPAIGASLLIIDEVSNLGKYDLAKDLNRNEHHEIDVKRQDKGVHRIFAIPIYVTNDPHPQFNKPGEIDRTLYIIQAPDQSSLKLNRSQWATFEAQRKQEVIAKVEWLDRPDIRAGIMRLLMEYPVTQGELEDVGLSETRKEDFLSEDLSPEQRALAHMLEHNMVVPKQDAPPLNRPFDKTAFNAGLNHFYRQYKADRHAKPLIDRQIARVLKNCLGETAGALQNSRFNDTKRIYWFPMQLGSLCDAFKEMTGCDIPRDLPAHQEVGPYVPTDIVKRNSLNVWERVDINSAF